MKRALIAAAILPLAAAARAGAFDELRGLAPAAAGDVPAIAGAASPPLGGSVWTWDEAQDLWDQHSASPDLAELAGSWKRVAWVSSAAATQGTIDMSGVDLEGRAGRITVAAGTNPLQSAFYYVSVPSLSTASVRLYYVDWRVTLERSVAAAYVALDGSLQTGDGVTHVRFNCRRADTGVMLCRVGAYDKADACLEFGFAAYARQPQAKASGATGSKARR